MYRSYMVFVQAVIIVHDSVTLRVFQPPFGIQESIRQAENVAVFLA